MPGIFLFWHFGGHLYIYNIAEVGTSACMQYVMGKFTGYGQTTDE